MHTITQAYSSQDCCFCYIAVSSRRQTQSFSSSTIETQSGPYICFKSRKDPASYCFRTTLLQTPTASESHCTRVPLLHVSTASESPLLQNCTASMFVLQVKRFVQETKEAARMQGVCDHPGGSAPPHQGSAGAGADRPASGGRGRQEGSEQHHSRQCC